MAVDVAGQPVGQDYVDIRNGFSLRPPEGTAAVCCCPGSSPLSAPSMGPGKWIQGDLLRIGPSAELVRFVPEEAAGAPSCLIVHLLSLRKPTDCGELLAWRGNFWKRHPEQAAVTQTRIRRQSEKPQGFLQIQWRQGAESEAQWIHEAILQSQEDRYFLLSFITGPAGADEMPGQMEALVDSFHCFDKNRQDQQWQQGLEQGQKALEKLPERLVSISSEESFYYLIRDRQGRNEGFLCFTQASPEAENNPWVISFHAYLEKARPAQTLARIQGWERPALPSQNAVLAGLSGEVWFGGHCRLDGPGAGEHFDYVFTCRDHPELGYRQEGTLQNQQLRLLFWPDLSRPDTVTKRMFSFSAGSYLPQAGRWLLGRVLDKRPQDYVFSVYANDQLHDMTVHVTHKEAAALSEAYPETIYMLEQAGVGGAVVESWFDQDGRLLLRRGCGLRIQRAKAEEIKGIWPQAYERALENLSQADRQKNSTQPWGKAIE